ncbi:hypothetical protein [Caulobacter vibrioides]|uniref:Uncharacterized protein n=2 Tax=Caulobacter vibrioides TaxID=155892 RepID=Q9A660_CAUVC|nr:hypothetical protein [Caulobacter vibrioides]YP_002517690.1 hypothetical protein CCNA_02317 [Caulobacter vibrioides NA1000]AAK24205.1 hypothetical protein CC_2234 [Caulobacter vibrioides CB15]ACL95782.1 hypothetical protein CCNA_02317 [Caulobacter vibrioides NA1000]ATC29098.1 hypothetical protein CA607_12155 [Caulobacter vibrioides]QXZ50612.1 hypothetical protein KZH45_11915 [Caulobacter vibrioides]
MSEQTGTQARRQAIALRLLVASALVGAVGGAGLALLEEMGVTPPASFLGYALLALAPVMIVISVIYWRNIDEAAREAHKFAWFWGGSGSILLAAPLAMLVGDARLTALAGQHTPSEWFAIGVFSLLFVQLSAYSLVWAIWWLRQR